jgi:hypothetical protein
MSQGDRVDMRAHQLRLWYGEMPSLPQTSSGGICCEAQYRTIPHIRTQVAPDMAWQLQLRAWFSLDGIQQHVWG